MRAHASSAAAATCAFVSIRCQQQVACRGVPCIRSCTAAAAACACCNLPTPLVTQGLRLEAGECAGMCELNDDGDFCVLPKEECPRDAYSLWIQCVSVDTPAAASCDAAGDGARCLPCISLQGCSGGCACARMPCAASAVEVVRAPFVGTVVSSVGAALRFATPPPPMVQSACQALLCSRARGCPLRSRCESARLLLLS